MKIIRYKVRKEVNHGTKSNPKIKEVFYSVIMTWSEGNEEIAKKKAYNGEYTIEDDGIEEVVEPTQLDRVEAQVTYTAMMTDTLLTEV